MQWSRNRAKHEGERKRCFKSGFYIDAFVFVCGAVSYGFLRETVEQGCS